MPALLRLTLRRRETVARMGMVEVQGSQGATVGVRIGVDIAGPGVIPVILL